MNYSLGKANPYQQFYRLVNPSNRMYRCNNVFECTFSWEQYKRQFKWKYKNVLFFPNFILVYNIIFSVLTYNVKHIGKSSKAILLKNGNLNRTSCIWSNSSVTYYSISVHYQSYNPSWEKMWAHEAISILIYQTCFYSSSNIMHVKL